MASRGQFTYELPSQGQNDLDRELKTGAKKEVFERWTKAVDCHYPEARICAKPTRKRDASPSVKPLVDREFVL